MGEKGEEWGYKLKKIYSICIMDFLYSKTAGIRDDIKLCKVPSGEIFSDAIHIIMLQVPKISARVLVECRRNYEKMLLLLKLIKEGMRTIEELKAEVDATPLSQELKETFKKMLDTTNIESLSEEERQLYEMRRKAYRDNMSAIDFATNKGLAEGEAKGKREQAISIAQSLKTEGLAPEIISKCTGLSLEEISQL